MSENIETEETEEVEETEDVELTDSENELAIMFPESALGGEIKGFFAANGTEKLSWTSLNESKRIVYIFDALSGLRFYLRAQVVDGYLKITTEMGQ